MNSYLTASKITALTRPCPLLLALAGPIQCCRYGILRTIATLNANQSEWSSYGVLRECWQLICSAEPTVSIVLQCRLICAGTTLVVQQQHSQTQVSPNCNNRTSIGERECGKALVDHTCNLSLQSTDVPQGNWECIRRHPSAPIHILFYKFATHNLCGPSVQ